LPETAARARWSSELGNVLSACARVVRREGRLVLVVADTVIGRRPLYADDLVREIAPAASLEVSVVGSQLRPHFHGPTARAFDRRPRREHAIVCRPKPAR
jgi:hypothetical protein